MNFQQAIHLAHTGKLTESKALLKELYKTDRKNINLLMLLADIYSKTNELKKSEKLYIKIIQHESTYAPAHTNLAMLFHSQGKLRNAEKYYQSSLKLDNNQPVAHFNLGAILQAHDRIDDAALQYQEAIEANPGYAKAYANLGYILRQKEQFDQSVINYRKALEFSPDTPEIHYNLGLSLLAQGYIDEAEQCHNISLQLNPGFSDAWAGLGAVHAYKDNTLKTMECYEQALNLNKNNINAMCDMAKSFSAQGLHEKAMEYVKQALLLGPNNIETRLLQGNIFLSLGNLEKVLSTCKFITRISPGNISVLGLSAAAYEKSGDANKAYSLIEPLLDNNPKFETVMVFSSLSKSLDRIGDAITMMESVLTNNNHLTPSNYRHIYFSLGKACDTLGDYDTAFNYFDKGNKLKKTSFSIENHRNEIDALMNTFNRDFISEHTLDTSSTRPVFIIGMPRSGTSLVEQILASHPNVFGAGELDDITNIAVSLYTKHTDVCLQPTDKKKLSTIAKIYTDRLEELNSSTLRVTDKMPGNFMHLGLINILFPNAYIIHCIRDPLDTCLSCFFQDFGRNHPWKYNLKNIGQYYGEYRRLMDHWYNLNIKIHDITYEDLVENQKAVTKKLLGFTALDWDDNCLQFHKNKRFIWTASYNQVRQPLYKKSVARWKNYESHIETLIETLRNENSLPGA